MRVSTVLEMVCFLFWVAGIVYPEHRATLWAFPAGWGGGVIGLKWYLEARKGGKSVKVINLTEEDLPPEVKDHLDSIIEGFQKSGKLPSSKKCDDPHCENCWGLGDNKHKT